MISEALELLLTLVCNGVHRILDNAQAAWVTDATRAMLGYDARMTRATAALPAQLAFNGPGAAQHVGGFRWQCPLSACEEQHTAALPSARRSA